MIYKIRMFLLWVFAKLMRSYQEDRTGFFFTIIAIEVVFCAAFFAVDFITGMEYLRGGWFYNLARIPTYLLAILMVLGLLFSTAYQVMYKIVQSIRNGYKDYEAFMISGGDQKLKNRELDLSQIHSDQEEDFDPNAFDEEKFYKEMDEYRERYHIPKRKNSD